MMKLAQHISRCQIVAVHCKTKIWCTSIVGRSGGPLAEHVWNVSLPLDMFNRCVIVLNAKFPSQHLPRSMIVHEKRVSVVRKVYPTNQVIKAKKDPINGLCLLLNG